MAKQGPRGDLNFGKWYGDDDPADRGTTKVHYGAWDPRQDERRRPKDVIAARDYKAPWEYDGPLAGPVTTRMANFDHGSRRQP